MARWKDDGTGKPVWDANDSGPDQIQGMPAGGPQGQQALSGAGSPWGGGGPINGGWGSEGPGGWTGHAQDPGWGGLGGQQQPPQGGAGGSFNPPNVWQQPDEAETPGWGPIKISTHYQPGEGFPHPFEHGFHMPGGQNPGNDGVTGYGNGNNPRPGQPMPNLRAMLGQAPNNAGTPTPNPGEDYKAMFSRFLNDYHAPDRDDVMSNIIKNDPNPIMYGLDHTMGQGGPQSTASDFTPNPDAMRQILQAQQPHHGGLFGSLANVGVGLGGALGGGGMNPLVQQLLARKMNGGM